MSPSTNLALGVDCQPLLDVATKDLFRKNAFRITGLPVDVTTREVTKYAAEIKMLAELGQNVYAQNAAFPIKPSPTFDEIREAIQRLRDPEQRLIDEFFWFWPETFGESQADLAIQALENGDSKTAIVIWKAKEPQDIQGITAKHNLAIANHIWALDMDIYSIDFEETESRRKTITDYWTGALNRWERLATDERLWKIVTERIRQLNEPNLPQEFALRMRATLPETLATINAALAVMFVESGKQSLARLHLQLLQETNQGLVDIEKVTKLVLTPTRNRVTEQLRQAKESATKNPQNAANTARKLLDQTQNILSLFDLFCDKYIDFRNELFDDVAASCFKLQVTYWKTTGDDKTCLEILEEIHPLTISDHLKQLIEKDIRETIERLNLQKEEKEHKEARARLDQISEEKRVADANAREKARLDQIAKEKRVASAYALLKAIQESKESPYTQLERFDRDAIPAIVEATGITGFSQNYGYLAASSITHIELFDSAANVLRGISNDAWNKHNDLRTALKVIELAIRHAISPALKKQLADDKATLEKITVQNSAASTSHPATDPTNKSTSRSKSQPAATPIKNMPLGTKLVKFALENYGVVFFLIIALIIIIMCVIQLRK